MQIYHVPLETSNVNIASSDIFNCFQNCCITINYVVDLKSLHILESSHLDNNRGFFILILRLLFLWIAMLFVLDWIVLDV
jgi:hypothetical protein